MGIGIVFKPVKAPVVNGEGLYEAEFNRTERLFKVRAANVAEAERKLMIMLRHQVTGKTFSFNADDFPQHDRKEVANGERPEGDEPGK